MGETNNQQTPGKNDLKAGVVFLVLALVILVVGGAFYLLGFGRGQIITPMPAPVADGETTPPPGKSPTEDFLPPAPESKPGEWVSVDWLPSWVSQGKQQDNDGYDIKVHKAGKVTSGRFTGKDLYMAESEGIGIQFLYFVLENNNKIFFDKQVPIIGIRGVDDVPEFIALKGTSYKLRKGYPGIKWEDVQKASNTPLFTDSVLGPVYLSKEGDCFIVRLPNGLTLGYDLMIPFISETSRVLQATWNSGGKNTSPYQYNIPTCASMCNFLNIVKEAELKPETRFEIIGKTTNGENLYGIKDKQDKVLQDIYNDKDTMAYIDDQNGYKTLQKNKYSYDQFTSMYPLVYWKDPLGRWVEMKNEKFEVAAEMCKPVIYLYPTKPMDVSVKVKPNGGFTLSIPPYGNGWKVRALGDGSVFDYATGKNYPYLFWEGLGMQYPLGEDGFVVEKKNVATFFDGKLAQLGLNQKEVDDFKDYWVERLSKENGDVFHIRFLTNNEFNAIAPLEISPKPNNIIRVMMTVRPTDKNVTVRTQDLPAAPSRTGFTVVEWGGTLLR